LRARHVLVALALCACRAEQPRATIAPPVVSDHARTDPELLRTIAILANGKVPTASAIDDAQRELDGGRLAIGGYIDSLLADPLFASEIAPRVIFRSTLTTETHLASFVLNETATSPVIHYLRKPCALASAVTVRPWWDLDHEILVCPDSYRPDKWTGDPQKGAREVACYSGFAVDRGCGCGPNLVRCLPSKAAKAQLKQSLRDEVRETVAYVASHDQPLDSLFLGNETWRNRDAELFRRTQTIESRKMANPEALFRDAASWPAEGKWAPREELAPGHQAGLLTAPQVMYIFTDRRQRMTTLYDLLWCDEPDSAGATPEVVSKIAGTSANFQLSQDHWKELAARPICTNCHARLDYGLQFFQGYDNGLLSEYFTPELQYKTRGPLYERDVDDLRGEGELNPHGFAELALAQPEYRRCMARDFAEYVLGNRTTAADIAEVVAQIGPTSSPRQVMRAALLDLARQWSQAEPAPAPIATAADGSGDITVSTAIRHDLDEHCMDCHDHDPTRPDFSPATLSRATVVDMLDQIAYGAMPRNDPLASAPRAELVESLIEATFPADQATVARDYYLGRMAALPAYRPEVIFSMIHQRAGAEGLGDWRMMERSTRTDVQPTTPGLVIGAGVEAIEACKQRHTNRAEIDACIAASLRLENLAVDRR
jgi:hypothetical protein